MKILGVIPARYASTRLPGKPLANICGKSMIQRVYEQAQQAQTIAQVTVATDDSRIFEHVKNFGGQAVLTSTAHQSGTDRCAEVAEQFPEFEGIINIQGDEPLIDPKAIDLLGNTLNQPGVQLATLIKVIQDETELNNPNIPKVICNKQGRAIYFSRHSIPYLREFAAGGWLQKHVFYKHVGIYAYRSETLQQITKLPISSLEKAENLEQLRWIENGWAIKTAITTAETLAVDTPEDLEQIIRMIQSR